MTENKLHPAQLEVYQDETRFRVVSTGRQFGKTTLGIACINLQAVKGKRCLWLSPTSDIGHSVYNELYRTAHKNVERESTTPANKLEFKGGGRVEVLSALQVRDFSDESIDFVVFDEAAYMSPKVWSNIQPLLIAREGAALFLSTPDSNNWFYELWRRGQGGYPDWKSWTFPTEANPDMTSEKMDFLRRSVPRSVWYEQYLGAILHPEIVGSFEGAGQRFVEGLKNRMQR